MATILPYGLNLVAVAISVALFMISALSLIAAFKVRRSDKIAFMRRKAKELNIPIIKVADLSGYVTSALAIVNNNEEDIYFEDKLLSLRIRPSFLDVAEPLVEDGIKTYYYFGKWYYPTGIRGLTCLLDVVDTIREEVPELSFIDDDMALVLTSCVYEGDALKYNCNMLLQDYEQSEYMTVDGIPVQATTTEEQPVVGLDGEQLIDEEDELVYEEVDVLSFNEHNEPIYKENPDKIDNIRLLELMKKSKQIVMANNLRAGYIPVRRAVQLIPGRADGHRLDTLIKLREKKRDIQNASKEKWTQNLIIAAAIVFGGITACYLVYILMGK